MVVFSSSLTKQPLNFMAKSKLNFQRQTNRFPKMISGLLLPPKSMICQLQRETVIFHLCRGFEFFNGEPPFRRAVGVPYQAEQSALKCLFSIPSKSASVRA